MLIANGLLFRNGLATDPALLKDGNHISCAVVGLIGGVRVYIKWQSGDQDTQKAIMGWFGACLFLILVGVVIKAFFV